jgi:alpha-1,2-glucosyltransferase
VSRTGRLLLTGLALGIWGATVVASGSIGPNDGFGPYAAFREMVEGSTLKGGDELTRLSPLFPALAWLPYVVSSNLILSLRIIDALAMGLLVFSACVLCDEHRLNPWVTAIIAVNIPLLARFSKMTAFAPGDPSLCASAALMSAIAAVHTNRFAAQFAAQVAAVTLSPVGIAAPLHGVLRAVRCRVNTGRIAMLYGPPAAIWCVVQWWARGGVTGAASDFMPTQLIAALDLWRRPVFVTLAAAAACTAAGGLVLPAVLRPSCLRATWRTTPEAFVLFGIVCINALSTGSTNVWGFLLPMWVLLWADCLGTLEAREARIWLIGATAVTLATQIPFAYSSVESYEASVHAYAVYRTMPAATASLFVQPWLLPIGMLVVILGVLASAYLMHLDATSARSRERDTQSKIDPYLWSALVLMALGFVLRPDRGTAVDENVHLDQILRFAHGDWSINRALTMLPGFHALVAIVALPVGVTESSVRLVVFGLSLGSVVVFHTLARQLDPSTAGMRTLQFTLLPALFHQFFLIYTDVASLLFVLLMMLQAVRGRYAAAGAFGFAAMLIRQDNVVWVAFAVAWSSLRDSGWQWRPVTEWLRRYATFIVSGCAFALFVLANHGQVALGDDAPSHPTGVYGGNVFFFLFVSAFMFVPLWWSYLRFSGARVWPWWIWLGGAGLFVVYWFGFVVDHPHNLERSDYFLANAILLWVTGTAARRSLAFVPVAVAAAGFAIAPMKRGWWVLLPFSALFLLPEWLIVPRYYLIPWSLFLVAREAAPPRDERRQTLVFAALSACAFVFVNGGYGWI